MRNWIVLIFGFVCFTPFVYAQQVNLPTNHAHVFYYAWYGNPEVDGAYSHWNHPVIYREEGKSKQYKPSEDIGANYYPEAGLYSSNDPKIIQTHMRQIKNAGVGVIVVSWWGEDDFSDKTVDRLMKTAENIGLKVTFHIEPYPGRNALQVKKNIQYIIDEYGNYNSFYRLKEYHDRPMFYIYDSYLIDEDEWATILDPDSPDTIRGTKYDAVMIGLWVKRNDGNFMEDGYFDGYYTYFATTSFTYGSTPSNWPQLQEWAEKHDKIFIPSVGPGYIDTRIRPWNGQNTRSRKMGDYYATMFRAAIDVEPEFISITSFNEWHEGTQIEPAIPKKIEDYTYEDYSPKSPDFYLDLTRSWVKNFMRKTK